MNGQRGTIMALTNSSQDRLPVKLDSSGKRVSIKPENLERLSQSAPTPSKQEPKAAASPRVEDDDDDDMPPLEYVGAAAPAPTPSAQPEDDDDDMPPLEYVGGSAPAQQPAANPEDDDDDMPPLEYIGSSAPAQQPAANPEDDDDMPPLEYVGSSAPAQQPTATPEDDDEMPPLEYVGTSPAATPSFTAGDKVVLKGLSRADLNGKHGTVMPSTGSSKDRLPIKLDDKKSLQSVLIKPENLEHVSAAPAVDDDDDEMPPLDYVGMQPTQQAASQPTNAAKPPGAVHSDSEDSMPPLEYVGASSPERTGPAAAAPETAAAEDDDDDMPPLEYVGAPGAGTQQPGQAQAQDDDDDDMPPLEYVGCSPSPPAAAPAATPVATFKEGDAVVLKGLSKAELNGQRGAILAFSGAGQGGRLPVRLQSSGQKVSIKPENLERAPAAAAAAAAPAPAVAPTANGPQDADDDDDDMPPLEYVAASGDASFLEGDTVVLKGLSGKAELNGQRGTVLPFLKRANGRLDVRLQGTGEKVSVKPVNLEKVSSSVPAVAQAQPPAAGAAGDDADDDDDMPPLEYVGVGSKPQPAAGPPAAAGDDGDASDDSMPPLDYAGTAAPASQEQPPTGGEPQTTFSVGDMVVLTGLRTTQLNGERARVIQELDAETSRVQVKLLGSGKKMLVKPINIQKAAAVSSDEEESGKRPAPGPPNTGTASADTTKNPEALLEQMRQAMQSTSVAPVLEALAHVEAAEGMEWGDLLPRKKQLLKKLRAKKRKLQPQEDESQAPPDTPERGGGAPDAASKSKATSDSSAHSEKDWVVLGKKGATTVAPAAAAPGRGLVRTPAGPKAAPPAQSTAGAAAPAAAAAGSPKPTQSLVRQWCEELQLPASLAEALEAEEVADPQELTGVPDEELSELAKHMKIGPKGRFMKAIRKMKALEQAELGSTCGSIA
uniref:Uncharacterized protein n=1 Tax=Alexandrium monilatum TaxID=311494 RepID=A0A7S4VU49_9DINO